MDNNEKQNRKHLSLSIAQKVELLQKLDHDVSVQRLTEDYDTKEYKRETDSNSPTGPNEAVCLKETKGQQVEGTSPPTPPSSQSWPEEEVIPCSMEKLSWNLYRKVRKQEYAITIKKKFIELNFLKINTHK